MSVIKNRSTEEGREFWNHVDSAVDQMKQKGTAMSQTDAVKELSILAWSAADCLGENNGLLRDQLMEAVYAVKREQEVLCPRCSHPLDRHKDTCKYVGDCSGDECGFTYLVYDPRYTSTEENEKQTKAINKLPNNQYSASITNHNVSASHYGFETLEEAEAWVEVMKSKVIASPSIPDDIFSRARFNYKRSSYYIGDN